MAGHKKGKARAERRERATARDSDAIQQPEASTAAQQLGPSNAIRQPVPSTSVQASEPKNAVQSGDNGIQLEGEEDSEWADPDGDPISDEPSFPVLHELSTPPPGEETGPIADANAPAPDDRESETVPNNATSTGGDFAGQSAASEQSRRGNVNPMYPAQEVKKKRRRRDL